MSRYRFANYNTITSHCYSNPFQNFSRIARGLSTSSTGSGSSKAGTSASEPGPSGMSKSSLKPSMKRFYTCPLDQVVQEMDQTNRHEPTFA